MFEFLSKIDWSDILKTLGSTAIIIAAITFISKALIEHFFRRDLEAYKSVLKRAVDLELSDAKARSDAALLAQKAEFDLQAETFKTGLSSRSAHADRVRQEVVRWANPILGSVVDLQSRLRSILDDHGYLALSPDCRDEINTELVRRLRVFSS